jgi:release factor glutamine methyltransferase
MKTSNLGPKKTSFNNIQQAITWLLNEKYQGKLTGAAIKDIERLKQGEPVDYVIGYKDFLGCKIDLSFKPLIPREETEYWIKDAILEKGKPQFTQKVVKRCSPKSRLRVLDVFAGSGCCGIAILKHIKNSHCDFLDIDNSCLKQIRLNLKLNKIAKNRYRIIKSNIFSAFSVLPTANYKLLINNYQLILANPPYIPTAKKTNLPKSVLDFEQKAALLARDNGLFYIKRFLQEAKKFLAKDGVIYLEFDSPQKNKIAMLLKKYGYQHFKFQKDQFHKWRLAIINHKSSPLVLLEKIPII